MIDAAESCCDVDILENLVYTLFVNSTLVDEAIINLKVEIILCQLKIRRN